MRLDVERLALHTVRGGSFSDQAQAVEFRLNGGRLSGGLSTSAGFVAPLGSSLMLSQAEQGLNMC